MTVILGARGTSPWTAVIRRPPTHAILTYVHESWNSFVTDCTNKGASLQNWIEPELTQALQAWLAKAKLRQEQPFDGDFLAESQTFDLDPETCKPFCVSRTDIEYMLTGVPRFTIEFKILDGSSSLRTKYWKNGVTRFVSSTYSPTANEAAMWSFLRSKGHLDGTAISNLLKKNAALLNCTTSPGTPFRSPSRIAGKLGLFDSVHLRSNGASPIEIAHLFVALP